MLFTPQATGCGQDISLPEVPASRSCDFQICNLYLSGVWAHPESWHPLGSEHCPPPHEAGDWIDPYILWDNFFQLVQSDTVFLMLTSNKNTLEEIQESTTLSALRSPQSNFTFSGVRHFMLVDFNMCCKQSFKSTIFVLTVTCTEGEKSQGYNSQNEKVESFLSWGRENNHSYVILEPPSKYLGGRVQQKSK